MNIAFVDLEPSRLKLLPLTYTRPIACLRVGILSVYEKWMLHLEGAHGFVTEGYLSSKFPPPSGEDFLLINGSVCPTEHLVEAIGNLKTGEVLMANEVFIAGRQATCPAYGETFWESLVHHNYDGALDTVERPWDIFHKNGDQIEKDFAKLTHGRKSLEIKDPNVIAYNAENIFIEEGASLKACIIDAEKGPVYIGRDARVAPGAIIEGPFAMCEGAHVNMGAKIRTQTTVGPYAKVGGEVSNSVIQGYSNKGHEGFLGNAVIGEWCNIGADTNNSNLKNNYTNVKVWDYEKRGFSNTGLQFCGLIMGDHSKCGINTMFNTGTVIGVGANIFGAGFPRNFIPSFSWGGAAGFSTFGIKKALETAGIVMARRSIEMDADDEQLLTHVFQLTKEFRYWEKESQ